MLLISAYGPWDIYNMHRLSGLPGYITKARTKGTFLHSLGGTFTTNLLLMLVNMVRPFLLARLLGPAGKGEIVAITAWPTMLVTLGVLGIPEALVYFASRRKDRMNLLTTSWMILAPVAVIVMAGGYWLMPHIMPNQSAQTIASARMFLLIVPLGFVTLTIHGIHRSYNNFQAWNRLRLLKPTFYLVGLIIAWQLTRIEANYVAFLWLILNAVATAIIFASVRQYGSIWKARPNPADAPPLMRYGIHSALGTAPEVLNNRLDQLIMIAFLTTTDLGLYSTAVSWSIFFLPIAASISQVAFPFIARQKNEARRFDQFRQTFQIGTGINFLMCIVMALVTPVAFTFVYGVSFADALPATYVLIAAAFFLGTSRLLEAGLLGLGHPISSAIAEATGLLITLVGLLILLKPFGILGAAIVSLVAYFITCTVLIVYMMRKTDYPVFTLFQFRSFWKNETSSSTEG